MSISIHFTQATVKLLVRRTSALLGPAKSKTIAQIAQTLSTSRQTVYNWLKGYCSGRLAF
ncbi:MAG: helix-turn-helix domain-containing protein [Chloroflexi bacterium]|nr:helix-turn-helix domain-containing protein [Chloroflexota bacterium]